MRGYSLGVRSICLVQHLHLYALSSRLQALCSNVLNSNPPLYRYFSPHETCLIVFFPEFCVRDSHGCFPPSRLRRTHRRTFVHFFTTAVFTTVQYMHNNQSNNLSINRGPPTQQLRIRHETLRTCGDSHAPKLFCSFSESDMPVAHVRRSEPVLCIVTTP